MVVNAPDGIRADLARAGDEPLMLARQLPGVPILVASDRYLAGRLAEHHFDVTVHLLDDGFQHLQLDRDLDLVIVAAGGSRSGRADAAVRPPARSARRTGRGGCGPGGESSVEMPAGDRAAAVHAAASACECSLARVASR